jgi:hypothetical protein
VTDSTPSAAQLNALQIAAQVTPIAASWRRSGCSSVRLLGDPVPAAQVGDLPAPFAPPSWISCFLGLAGDEYVIEQIAQHVSQRTLSAYFKETAGLRVRAIAGRVETEDKCDRIVPCAMP